MSAEPVVDVGAYLKVERERVELALERAVRKVEVREDVSVDEASAIRYGVMGDGKRLRPILCVTAHIACGGTRSAAIYDLAASLEMVHAYSLMHDDLPCMDDASLRRGRPTSHVEHGVAVTTRAAAKLIPLSAIQALEAARILGCTEEDACALSQMLMRAAGGGGMIGGQWVDLIGEGRAFGAQQLNQLHRMKTGALLAASLEIGAVSAGGGETVSEALVGYGWAIGLAFQIVDDILDVTSSAEALGKNPSDTELQKSTYTALYGLDGARAKASAQIESALDALRPAGIRCAELNALAHFVVERGR